MRIKNALYKSFLKGEPFRTISSDDMVRVLNNVTGVNGRYVREARAMLIYAYLTGARPAEFLSASANDFREDTHFIHITVKTVKRGISRVITLKKGNPMVRELWEFARRFPPNVYVFYHFRGKAASREFKSKTGRICTVKPLGDKIRYHFKNWFSVINPEGIPPYYLRHNRFTKLSQAGISLQDIQQMKGSKNLESVMPYVHQSTYISKRIARKNE